MREWDRYRAIQEEALADSVGEAAHAEEMRRWREPDCDNERGLQETQLVVAP